MLATPTQLCMATKTKTKWWMLLQPSSYAALPKTKDNTVDPPTAGVLLPQAQDNEKQRWTNPPSQIVCTALTTLLALTALLRIRTTSRALVNVLFQKKETKWHHFHCALTFSSTWNHVPPQ